MVVVFVLFCFNEKKFVNFDTEKVLNIFRFGLYHLHLILEILTTQGGENTLL